MSEVLGFFKFVGSINSLIWCFVFFNLFLQFISSSRLLDLTLKVALEPSPRQSAITTFNLCVWKRNSQRYWTFWISLEFPDLVPPHFSQLKTTTSACSADLGTDLEANWSCNYTYHSPPWKSKTKYNLIFM